MSRTICPNRLYSILLSILFIPSFLYAQKTSTGIGLTLSGGGAKGLAHIGILKAIDSAELNISYITGTSMGSIVGGLYAAGYSGDSIEAIARKIDWDILLSNSIPMSSYNMEEKAEYGKYAVELPVINKKLSLPSGFLESQELWLILEKYFFPVASIHEFDSLSIPYRCIGTDLATGEPVVLGKGNIVSSIRASMAIPGVFSPVDINNQRLVDGGVTRNFPVRDVKAMGATYAIGVSVSSPLKNVEELNDPIKILTQVVFLNENKDRVEAMAITDFLIQIPMGSFTSASFDAGEAIIQLGIEEGRKLYPKFKRMADSLKALYPDYTFTRNRLPENKIYKLSAVEVEGLNDHAKKIFMEQISLKDSTEITETRVEKESREVFAYRTYKSVAYDIQKDTNGTHKLIYRVKPESSVVLKAGLSQNTFTGFAVNINLTARNLLTDLSRSLVSVNLGKNFRALLEHQQIFGYKRPWSNRFQIYSEFQELPTYTDFIKTGLYKLKYFTIDDRFQLSAKRRSAGGIGIQWENIEAIPEIQNGLYLDGNNNYFHVYAFWQFNNLAKPQYPKKGTQIELKGGYAFNVSPNFQVFEDGAFIGDIKKELIQYGSYFRATAFYSNIKPFSRHWALISRLQGGINLSGNQSLLNGFVAGGMNPTMHNQIVFAGLKEGEVTSESIAAAHLGIRYHPFGKVYATLVGSVMNYDFIEKKGIDYTPKWVVGTGLTLAYDLSFGPIEITLMLANKSKGVESYFNFGFPFKL